MSSVPTSYKVSTITATGDIGVQLDLDALYNTVPLVGWEPGCSHEWGFVSVQFAKTVFRDATGATDNSPTSGDIQHCVNATSETDSAPIIIDNETNPNINSEKDSKKDSQKNSQKDKSNSDIEVLRRAATDSQGRAFPVQESSRRKRRQVQHFDNQCTLIYWSRDRKLAGSQRDINVKCFRNGKIQMTGVKSIEDGKRVLLHVAETVAAMDPRVILSHTTPRASSYKVCLINSDFDLGILVKREALYNVLKSDLQLAAVYEPCGYPGVKLKFMWNQHHTSQNHSQQGVCKCTPACTGKGDGCGLGNCRKVTCLIFQSGCTIITGAHSYTQLDDVHSFMCSILAEYRQDIERIRPVIMQPSE
jgi:TATA-box binding protein (TBP) (component of TFIID and TFIIIB)